MMTPEPLHNATYPRICFLDTALVDGAIARMMSQQWDCVVVPSLFVLKCIRKQWQQNGPSILPKMVTYVHPLTYTNPCVLDQKPVSLGQGMAWCLDFFQNYFSENSAAKPVDLAGFSRSLLHLWEHIDRRILYDHQDPQAFKHLESQGLILRESLLQSSYLSGTPHLVQEWLKWWPQWLHRHHLCSQTRASYLAQNYAAQWWEKNPSLKILLCVQNIEKSPTEWLRHLIHLPNVWTLIPKDNALCERFGIPVHAVQNGLPESVTESAPPVHAVQNGLPESVTDCDITISESVHHPSAIVCAHDAESARVMAVLIQESLTKTESDVGLVISCSSMLKRVSFILKAHRIHLPIPHPSLINTLLQSIWRGSMQGWPLSEILMILRHPIVIKTYPIVVAMTGWIDQYRPKWPGIGVDLVPDWDAGMPRWLKRLHSRFCCALGPVTVAMAEHRIQSIKKTMVFWMDIHIQALEKLVPLAVWDHNDVVEKMLQERLNSLPDLDPDVYGQWFKAWTSTIMQMDQKTTLWNDKNHKKDNGILVSGIEDLECVSLDRCIIAVSEPLPEFPWMPKSWREHFHICDDHAKQNFQKIPGKVFLVSTHSTPSESIYRQKAKNRLPNTMLQSLLVQNDASSRPYPPLNRVSISDIQRWHTDPEAFYQERVLRIKENGISFQQAWGLAMHTLLDHFVRDFPPTKGFSAAQLHDGLSALANVFLPEMPWWQQASRRTLLYDIAECEHAHRQSGVKQSLTEQSGQMVFSVKGSSITLFGRADRIDYLEDGTAHIIDYKTGATPSFVSLDRMESVQLPLEVFMVQSGAMGIAMPVSKLSWWSLHLTQGCRVKTYPRCVSTLLDRYTSVVPQWMQQLASGTYGPV